MVSRKNSEALLTRQVTVPSAPAQRAMSDCTSPRSARLAEARGRGPARPLDLGGEGLRFIPGIAIVDGDPPAVGGEVEGDGAADAAR